MSCVTRKPETTALHLPVVCPDHNTCAWCAWCHSCHLLTVHSGSEDSTTHFACRQSSKPNHNTLLLVNAVAAGERTARAIAGEVKGGPGMCLEV